MAEMKEILVANLTLDTTRRNNIPPLIVPQGDYGARVIRAVITEQGKLVTVESAAAVSIVAERSGDGEALAFSGKVNADGSVTVPVTQWMLDVPEDDVICHVVVTGSDYQYSTTSFLIEPEKKANPTEITPDDPRKDVVTEVLAGEKERVLAEGIRRANENTRKSAEEARQRAEEQRLTDEATRVANEAARVSSELSRDATFKGWANGIASLPSFDSRISANSDRLTNIEAGLPSSVWHVDDTAARVKDVPENARPKAIVSKIGGMTYRDDTTNTLRSAKVTEVKSVGVNLFDIDKREFGTIDSNGDLYLVNQLFDFYRFEAEENTQYTLSAYVKNMNATGNGRFAVFYTDGSWDNVVLLNRGNDWAYCSFTTAAGKTVEKIQNYHGDLGAWFIKGGELMINEGTTAKPYTPYVEHILPIPEELRPANGINAEVYDSIELNENGSVTKRVKCGVVDLGTLDWVYSKVYMQFSCELPSKALGRKNMKCAPYNIIDRDGYASGLPDMSMHGHISISKVYVTNLSYSDAATFKAAMSGVMLVYELAEPEVTDTYADLIIDVEGGGTLTFEDEYGYDMPNTVTYMLKEVTS